MAHPGDMEKYYAYIASINNFPDTAKSFAKLDEYGKNATFGGVNLSTLTFLCRKTFINTPTII